MVFNWGVRNRYNAATYENTVLRKQEIAEAPPYWTSITPGSANHFSYPSNVIFTPVIALCTNFVPPVSSWFDLEFGSVSACLLFMVFNYISHIEKTIDIDNLFIKLGAFHLCWCVLQPLGSSLRPNCFYFYFNYY